MAKHTHRLEIFKDRKGEWRWRLRSRNGNITSGPQEGYARRGAATRAAMAQPFDWPRVKMWFEP